MQKNLYNKKEGSVTQTMKNKHFIGSAEFKTYEYCPLKWFYSQTVGNNTQNNAIKRGMEYHRKRSVQVQRVVDTQNIFKKIIITGGLIWLGFSVALLSQL